ncbi:hypothetical protein JTE90_012533 [Oedothorax gibbosus]|uniref:Secreted protein n=1 Tax=Oedothorax gibbosus TaxID=931172 RepID=A0AAV6U669_9ARAC|nr:hypothetical protein JTE90_012533 [Oedothorax gibbosus]
MNASLLVLLVFLLTQAVVCTVSSGLRDTDLYLLRRGSLNHKRHLRQKREKSDYICNMYTCRPIQAKLDCTPQDGARCCTGYRYDKRSQSCRKLKGV